MVKYALVLSLVFFAGSLAHAMGDGPCAKERETLCAGVQPGGGAVMKCLKENEEKLSVECKAHHEKMKEHMKDVHEACMDDVQKHCGDVKRGRGRVMKCLKKNHEALSEGCKAEIAEKKSMRKKDK